MADNTVLNPGASGDTVRDLARQSGTIKTQVVQLDLGGDSANAEVLITAGQQTMAASVPVAIASNQTAIAVTGTFWQTTQPVSLAALPSLAAGFSAIGSITNTSFAVTQATAASLNATVTPIAITKGTQGATGFTVQELKDAGRNATNYFMAAQVVSTSSETLQSLTGYKGGAAVTATTTPAVVTTGKTYRIQSLVITYVAISTAGAIQVNLRANTAGVVTVSSPLVNSWLVGATSLADEGDRTTHVRTGSRRRRRCLYQVLRLCKRAS